MTGDRLRTEAGRAEVIFPDGAALYLDEFSAVDLLSPSVLRLASGRAILIVPRETDHAAAVRYQIDTPFTSLTTGGAGTYRADAGRAYGWSSADPFDRWAGDRYSYRDQTRTRSAQYLPQGLRMYGGTLDRHGSWHYNATHGYVWYPTVVPVWRPYHNGRWTPMQHYGWTWIGVDAWSWPTHHYGRWGFTRGAWFWIPGGTWAPAWVTWAAAADYVSWCPLGFDGRPVFELTVGGSSRWNGWVIVPRAAFGARGYDAHRHAIDPRRLPPATPFIHQAYAPVAVPRSIHRTPHPQGPWHAGRPRAVDRPGAPSHGSMTARDDPRAPARASRAAPRYGYRTPEPPTVAPPMRAPAAPRYGYRTLEPPTGGARPGGTPAVPRYDGRPQYGGTAAPPPAPTWRVPNAEPPRPAAATPPLSGGGIRMAPAPGIAPVLPPTPATGAAVPRYGLPQRAPQPTRSPQESGSSGSQSSGARAHAPDSRRPR